MFNNLFFLYMVIFLPFASLLLFIGIASEHDNSVTDWLGELRYKWNYELNVFGKFLFSVIVIILLPIYFVTVANAFTYALKYLWRMGQK